MDGGLAEVIGVCLHGEAINADSDFLLFLFAGSRVGVVVAVGAGDFEYAVGNEVFSGTVALYDGLDQILGYVLIVREKLLGVFREAVAAVAEGRVVIVVADARVEADAFDDGGSVEAFYFGVGVEFIKIRYAESQVGVGEEFGGFRFGVAHENGVYRLFDRSLLEKCGECVRRFFCAFIHADDDATRIEVVIKRFGFAEEFRAEDDIVGVESRANVFCVANGYRGFDNDGRLGGAVCGNVKNKLDDRFYGAAVEEVLLGIVVGRCGNDDVVGVCVSAGCVCGCCEVKFAGAGFGFCEVLFYVVVLNGADVVVEFLNLLRYDVYRSDVVVLCEQNG